MEETSSPPPPQPQRQAQTFRSTASSNWRLKDESPRAEQQHQTRARYNRGQDGGGNPQNGHASPHSRNRDVHQTSSEEGTPGTRLYVGNLLYTAQRPDIEELFKNYGFNVVGVSMSTDPFTGRNPSYCFVDLDSAEEAQRAMSELNGVEVLGRALRVSPGVAKRHGQAGGGGGGNEMRMKDYERGQGRPRGVRETREQKDGEYNPTFDRWNRGDAQTHWTAPQSEGRRLYIGNMPRIEPQSAHDQEIQGLFAQYAPGIALGAVSKQISPRPAPNPEHGNNQYYCFVDLEKGEDVDAAIEALDGKQGSWGGNVRVNRARNSDRKVVKEQGSLNQERRVLGEGSWRRASAPTEEQ
ncbi:hypothetical protein G647_03408 [Cladophialophora carrionii CBS 160.54]|uniref:RRM domain-containing protein n=1 Tax=Cladophialophora carrionii CBS 160.54 TaxID=1279043 RepID=V9DAV6_9EURO|nr:uncharacterized protein G647_03408 [Cladophialophora carrionii CBS 160.54]ETI24039.1 hypothetical protein G647_03408 [Cladophialophora carrionii CBS 160.54]